MSVSRTCFDGLSVGYFGGWAVNPVDRSKSPTNVVAVAAIFKEKKIFRLTIAPHWSFVVSDMYNYDYNPEKTKKANNYPSVLVFYTKHSNR
ncbi:MAG: hypothetical protein J5I59_07075, partial [Saprospiraceae bacterium]|nr:hypothetical protein [Saprospiraceae bacterium]